MIWISFAVSILAIIISIMAHVETTRAMNTILRMCEEELEK